MNEIIKVNYDGDRQTTSARSLWEFLERPYTEFVKWFNQYKDYGFGENQDFRALRVKIRTAQGNEMDVADYEITIDMAKELCMLQKTEKGKRARQYFIDLEKRWNSPEGVMARALKMADNKLLMLKSQVKEMKPKAEYFDALVDRNLLTNFRDAAKELKTKESALIKWLLDEHYIYRDDKNRIKPYAQFVPKLFEIKEYRNRKTEHVGTQTLITPKGRETFRLLMV